MLQQKSRRPSGVCVFLSSCRCESLFAYLLDTSKGTETKAVSQSEAFIQIAYWKCAFLTWSLFSAWALHSLAGELMNSRSRYTAESKAIVCIIRKCALFSWRQQQQAEFEPENPQAELSWHRSLLQLFIPMLSEQSNKSSGLRTMELIAVFFVNAIACKKRFCSPIFQFQPEGSCAISTILSFGIPCPYQKLSELYHNSLWHSQPQLATIASEQWHFENEWCLTVIIPYSSVIQTIFACSVPYGV